MRLSVLAVLSLLLGGCCCTTVDRVGVKTLDPSRYAEINNWASYKKPTVVLADGRRFEARDFRFQDADATWRDATSGRPGGVEARLVREVRFANRARGMRNGAVYGGLAGLALGVLYGATYRGDPNDEGFPRGRWYDKSFLYGAVLGGWGYLLGIPVGAATGGEEVYLAPPPGPP